MRERDTAELPSLTALLPWQADAPRAGRGWARAVAREVLAARWRTLADAEPERRAALFRPSRSRALTSDVPQLPGQRGRTDRLAERPGDCPERVRVRLGGFDRQWLLRDNRLLDRPRPELWRVADPAQVFALLLPAPRGSGSGRSAAALSFSAELPVETGRVAPLYRRPGALDPNLAPGLTDHLSARYGVPVTAADVFAWIAATAAHPAALAQGPADLAVPLPRDPERWVEGLALGRRVLWLHTFGATTGERPRLPGGGRPFVRRAPTGPTPLTLAYSDGPYRDDPPPRPTDGSTAPAGDAPDDDWPTDLDTAPAEPDYWPADDDAGTLRETVPATRQHQHGTSARDAQGRPAHPTAPGSAPPTADAAATVSSPTDAPAPAATATTSGTGEAAGEPDAAGSATGVLHLGDSGRIAPVPRAAWEFRHAAAPVLASWFAERTAHFAAEPGSLETLGLVGWPQQLSTELIDLVGVLALLAELHPAQATLTTAAAADPITAADLRAAGVLPVPWWSARPASVLDTPEDGPGGQFALL